MTVSLTDRIKTRSMTLGVVGLGYVGFPLAHAYATAGIKVIGVDTSPEKVKAIKAGRYVLPELDASIYQDADFKKHFRVTSDVSELKSADVIAVCVPTPLTSAREPDLRFIREAFSDLRKYAKGSKLFILESTTYPRTTRDVVLPLLERPNYKAGKDFYLAFSPERIDPGNKEKTLKNTTKVVGGLTKECTRLTKLFYETVVDDVKPVSSPEAAEMTKLLENIFRCVNIALVNEMALICDRMGVDIWEVIEAANTKGFGFMPFYPGPGLGGHCIPIDPYYLSWQARNFDHHAEFIELAGKVNENMPYYVVNKIFEALNQNKKSLNGSKVLVIGVAYKKDVDDHRESPAMKVIELLVRQKASVDFYDPYVSELSVNDHKLVSLPSLTKQKLASADVTLIITDHSRIDYNALGDHSKLIVDTRNIMKGRKTKARVYFLGGGKW